MTLYAESKIKWGEREKVELKEGRDKLLMIYFLTTTSTDSLPAISPTNRDRWNIMNYIR